MNNNSEVGVKSRFLLGDVTSCLFGLLVLSIGIINMFWGNDPSYGIFIFLLSLVYLPLATTFLKKFSGLAIPLLMKIILGIFILWSALGVAELPEKIHLMMKSF